MASSVSVNVTANTSQAQSAINQLKSQLQSIAAKPINVDDSSIIKATQHAQQLQQILNQSMNINTGKLDLSTLNSNLSKAGLSAQSLQQSFAALGPEGNRAFLSFANTIAQAEAPTTRLNKSLITFGDTLKRTITWQLSSSMIHGVMGSVSRAVSYVKDLNESLTNIRIVTGQSTDDMAKFAVQANKAAKELGTTTTAYTNASLIYYQQGLSDRDVKARTDVTMKLANAAGISAEKASSQLTAIWNNFAQGSTNLEHYADVLVKLGSETASSSEEISKGMQKFAAAGKTVGLSYEYGASALATVTATTRESADTVGTAFRTLFSRLEGLKLGETLEDGTTVNKYSKALETVGVKIKNASGEMRSMDNILMDLGNRWKTLSKDQQIALAQTVGGARQYTTLIALMDNFDTFQQNINRANTADGTLQKQQEIYGEGWEAASKKVKASMEDIFDSLVNDQAAIKVTNFFSSVLDGVAGLIDGFGNLGGILSTVASIFTIKYAKEIPTIMSNLGQSMKSIFMPSSNLTGIKQIQEGVQKSFSGLRGAFGANDLVAQAEIDAAERMLIMNKSFQQNSYRMTQAERQAYQDQMNQMAIYNQQQIASAQRITAIQKEASEDKDAYFSNTKDDYTKMLNTANKQFDKAYTAFQADSENKAAQNALANAYDQANRAGLNLTQDKQTGLITPTSLASGQLTYSGYSQYRNTFNQAYARMEETAKTSGMAEAITSGIASRLQDTESMPKDAGDAITGNLIKNTQAQLREVLSTQGNNELDNWMNGRSPDDVMSKLTAGLSSGQNTRADLKTLQDNINSVLGVGDSKTGLTGLFKALDEERFNAATNFNRRTGSTEGTEASESMKKRAGQIAKEEQKKGNIQVTEADHVRSFGETVGQVASSLMMLTTVFTSATNLFNTLQDKNATATQQITAVLSTTSSSLMSIAQMSKFGTPGLITGILLTAGQWALPLILDEIDKRFENDDKRADRLKTQADFAKQQLEIVQDTRQQIESDLEQYNSYREQMQNYAKGTVEYNTLAAKANASARKVIYSQGLEYGNQYSMDRNGNIIINSESQRAIAADLNNDERLALQRSTAASTLQLINEATNSAMEYLIKDADKIVNGELGSQESFETLFKQTIYSKGLLGQSWLESNKKDFINDDRLKILFDESKKGTYEYFLAQMEAAGKYFATESAPNGSAGMHWYALKSWYDQAVPVMKSTEERLMQNAESIAYSQTQAEIQGKFMDLAYANDNEVTELESIAANILGSDFNGQSKEEYNDLYSFKNKDILLSGDNIDISGITNVEGFSDIFENKIAGLSEAEYNRIVSQGRQNGQTEDQILETLKLTALTQDRANIMQGMLNKTIAEINNSDFYKKFGTSFADQTVADVLKYTKEHTAEALSEDVVYNLWKQNAKTSLSGLYQSLLTGTNGDLTSILGGLGNELNLINKIQDLGLNLKQIDQISAQISNLSTSIGKGAAGLYAEQLLSGNSFNQELFNAVGKLNLGNDSITDLFSLQKASKNKLYAQDLRKQIKQLYDAASKDIAKSGGIFQALTKSEGFSNALELINSTLNPDETGLEKSATLTADAIRSAATSCQALNSYLKMGKTNAGGLAKAFEIINEKGMSLATVSDSFIEATSNMGALDEGLSSLLQDISQYQQANSVTEAYGFFKGRASDIQSGLSNGLPFEKRVQEGFEQIFGKDSGVWTRFADSMQQWINDGLSAAEINNKYNTDFKQEKSLIDALAKGEGAEAFFKYFQDNGQLLSAGMSYDKAKGILSFTDKSMVKDTFKEQVDFIKSALRVSEDTAQMMAIYAANGNRDVEQFWEANGAINAGNDYLDNIEASIAQGGSKIVDSAELIGIYENAKEAMIATAMREQDISREDAEKDYNNRLAEAQKYLAETGAIAIDMKALKTTESQAAFIESLITALGGDKTSLGGQLAITNGSQGTSTGFLNLLSTFGIDTTGNSFNYDAALSLLQSLGISESTAKEWISGATTGNNPATMRSTVRDRYGNEHELIQGQDEQGKGIQENSDQFLQRRAQYLRQEQNAGIEEAIQAALGIEDGTWSIDIKVNPESQETFNTLASLFNSKEGVEIKLTMSKALQELYDRFFGTETKDTSGTDTQTQPGTDTQTQPGTDTQPGIDTQTGTDTQTQTGTDIQTQTGIGTNTQTQTGIISGSQRTEKLDEIFTGLFPTLTTHGEDGAKSYTSAEMYSSYNDALVSETARASADNFINYIGDQVIRYWSNGQQSAETEDSTYVTEQGRIALRELGKELFNGEPIEITCDNGDIIKINSNGEIHVSSSDLSEYYDIAKTSLGDSGEQVVNALAGQGYDLNKILLPLINDIVDTSFNQKGYTGKEIALGLGVGLDYQDIKSGIAEGMLEEVINVGLMSNLYSALSKVTLENGNTEEQAVAAQAAADNLTILSKAAAEFGTYVGSESFANEIVTDSTLLTAYTGFVQNAMTAGMMDSNGAINLNNGEGVTTTLNFEVGTIPEVPPQDSIVNYEGVFPTSAPTLTGTVNYTGNFPSEAGATGGYVKARAEGGSINHPLEGGLTFTGEEGPEIVWNKEHGYAYVTGKKRPEFAYLRPGDRVFNAAETKAILSGSGNVQREYTGIAYSGGVVPAKADHVENYIYNGSLNGNPHGIGDKILSRNGNGDGNGEDKWKPERYHYILNIIKQLEREFDRLNKIKDRTFGLQHINAINAETAALEQQMDVNKTYMEEIKNWEQYDIQKLKDLGVYDEIVFDENGFIANYQELDEKYGKLAANKDENAKKVIEALKQLEETREKLKDAIDKQLDLAIQYLDNRLESIKAEIELKVNISTDNLNLLDTLLKRSKDDAYEAAYNIGLMGQQMDEYMTQLDANKTGLAKIIGEHIDLGENPEESMQGIISNIKNMSAEEAEKYLINAGFSSNDIEEIRKLLKEDESLLDKISTKEKEIFDQVSKTFSQYTSDIKTQLQLFTHYNTVLSTMKEISNLMSTSLGPQTKELISTMNKGMFDNAKNNATAAKNYLDNMLNQQKKANAELAKAQESGNEDYIKRYQDIKDQVDKEVNQAQEDYLTAWQNSLQIAGQILQEESENAAEAFEKSITSFYGSLESFREAYDRMSEVEEDYLADYDKLYELSKLNRDINKSIDDTDNISSKKKLISLQEEINKLQADGVKLSEHDVDVLRKRYELEIARQELEDSKNSKSMVTLSRDQNGNWGYVYTADDDKVAKAEQDYEDKLHALQESNDKYIKDLQGKLINLQSSSEEAINKVVGNFQSGKITESEANKQIRDILDYYEAQTGYFTSELEKVFGDQKATYELMKEIYGVDSAELMDTLSETVLGSLPGYDGNDISGIYNNLIAQFTTFANKQKENMSDYAESVEEANEAAGVKNPAEALSQIVADVGTASTDTMEKVKTLGEELDTAFTDAYKAVDTFLNAFEEKYHTTIQGAFDDTVDFINVFNDMIATLSNINATADPDLVSAGIIHAAARSAYKDAKAKHKSGAMSDKDWKKAQEDWDKAEKEWKLAQMKYYDPDAYAQYLADTKPVETKNNTKPSIPDNLPASLRGYKISGYDDRGFPLKERVVSWSEYQRYLKRKDLSVKTTPVYYDTGGYTGEWGNSGKLAVLHEKELVLNKNDTRNLLDTIGMLKALEVNASTYQNTLTDLISQNNYRIYKDFQSSGAQQFITISAEFPNATDRNEIQEAFNNLINEAAQYANRK